MTRLKRLIVEIHRRSLWQVLGIYVVGGWIAFQVAQTLTEGLGLPNWFLALGLLIVLLPVVVATAFVQEGVRGPQRPEAAEPAVREARRAHHKVFTWQNAILAGVSLLAPFSPTEPHEVYRTGYGRSRLLNWRRASRIEE
jgi:hypothetical protein